jgi:hypothetical protein
MRLISRFFMRDRAPQLSFDGVDEVRSEPSADCAIWHEVSRALDMAPRFASDKPKAKSIDATRTAGEGVS